jgi:hypothetical protein
MLPLMQIHHLRACLGTAQGLRHRRIVRLRGLVVVPNRDLALQVP